MIEIKNTEGFNKYRKTTEVKETETEKEGKKENEKTKQKKEEKK